MEKNSLGNPRHIFFLPYLEKSARIIGPPLPINHQLNDYFAAVVFLRTTTLGSGVEPKSCTSLLTALFIALKTFPHSLRTLALTLKAKKRLKIDMPTVVQTK